MQHISTILPSLTATISSLELTPDQTPQKSSSAVKNVRSLKGLPLLNDPWQQKWLGLAVSHPKVQEASDAVKSFAFDWFRHKRPRRLVLTGQSGCGKTDLAKSLFRYANAASMLSWERGHWRSTPGCSFLLWQEVCDRLEDSKASMVDILSDAIHETLLIVDDIGAESDRFKSGKGTDALGYLLTRRQDAGFTMLTTNVPSSGWGARWDSRVEDRLLRDSTVIDMGECPSWSSI